MPPITGVSQEPGCATSRGWRKATRTCGATYASPTPCGCAPIWLPIVGNWTVSMRCSRARTARRLAHCSRAPARHAPPGFPGAAEAAMSISASGRRDAQFLDIAPVARMSGTLRLPGSKSISNRSLLLAALARGTTELTGLLAADDVDRMRESLRTLGVRIEDDDAGERAVVHGVAGTFPMRQASLFLGNAGTAFRPLTAALALSHGDYELSGAPRMHERP